jgi:lipid-A-disaccharide synthase
MLVTLDYFTMVNIISKKMVYEEFLQEDVNADTLSVSIEKILPSGERRKEIEKGIEDMTKALSAGSGNASEQAAESVLRSLL